MDVVKTTRAAGIGLPCWAFRFLVCSSTGLFLFVPNAVADRFYIGDANLPIPIIHRAAVVDADGRRTEEDYSRAKRQPLSTVQMLFAPTGELRCTGIRLSAQLTGANDLITTAGHALVDDKTCHKRSNPTDCVFTIRIGSMVKRSRVQSMIATGINCPNKPDTYDDWAVLRIHPPITAVNPYKLPDTAEFYPRQQVIFVASHVFDFFRKSSRGEEYHPKAVEECEIRHIHWWMNQPILLESNCDGGQGASGGSLLTPTDTTPVLIGVTVANDENDAFVELAKNRKRPNSGPWKANAWATYHVPLAGAFLKTILRAIGDRRD